MAKHNYKDYNINLPLFPGYSKILVPPLHITLCYVKMPLSPCMKLFGEMNEMLLRCTIPSYIKSKEIRKVCLSVICLVINVMLPKQQTVYSNQPFLLFTYASHALRSDLGHCECDISDFPTSLNAP